MRRKKRAVVRIEGRDKYFLVSPLGRTEARHHAGPLALVEAQLVAMTATEPCTVEVRRQPLLGGSEHLAYRVVRNEDGHVLTFTEED